MTTVEMRRFLLGYGFSAAWKARVEKMSDKQVYAIYMRTTNLIRKGKK